MADFRVIAATGMALPEARTNRHQIDGKWCGPDATFARISPPHGLVVSRSAKGGAAESEAATRVATGVATGAALARTVEGDSMDGPGPDIPAPTSRPRPW